MSAEAEATDARYKTALEEAKWRYSTHGLTCGTRAYEYGTLVVKNAFLVAGGGLLFIPTMVGLSASVNLRDAVVAGLCFGVAVLLSLLANYIIHLNWLLHEGAWDKTYKIERLYIREAFGLSFENDRNSLREAQKSLSRYGRGIAVTFWIPHIPALLYIIFLCVAVHFLYLSFGVVWNGKAI